MKARMPQLPVLPLVGRTAELKLIRAAIDTADAGQGATIILAGEGGVGKTRLTRAAEEEAALRGWTVAVGRGYPVEVGSPYALFSDAISATLRRMPLETQRVLTRGAAELEQILPALRNGMAGAGPRDAGPDFKANLLWNFTQFLKTLAGRTPLLIVLEDLQWADSASLELLHFIARQSVGDRIVILGSYNSAYREDNAALGLLEQSLVSMRVATLLHVNPLTHADTAELIQEVFGADEYATREFCALVYGWTRGNAFFIEEVLKTIVASGRLTLQDGRWSGWESADFELPQSVRGSLLARLNQLNPEARTVADLMAVLGTHTTLDILEATAGLTQPQLLAAIYELRRARLIDEEASGDDIYYDFVHPLIRETVSSDLGPTRRRSLHHQVAEALEAYYDDVALDHADELAYHFTQALGRGHEARALRYLVVAGENALAKNANREAANYLGAALDRIDHFDGDDQHAQRMRVITQLAQARQRLGNYDTAMELWQRARTKAEQHGDDVAVAGIERRVGLSLFWSGRHSEALQRYEQGLLAARRAGDVSLEVKLEIAAAICQVELGQPADAQQRLQHALAIAGPTGDPALLARVNRSLLVFHTWMGPPDSAREHGRAAVELAAKSNQPMLEWSAHWSMAVLEGITGHSERMREEIAAARVLVEQLRSPLLGLWMDEMEIEYTYGKGEWDAAIQLAEHDISLARLFQQRTLLPRLLVWVALVYLGRGEFERAKAYIDEAWEISGAGTDRRHHEVHTVVPAHIGRAAYHLATSEWQESIRIGMQGLAIADKSGYFIWGIHRLIPIIAESHLWLNQFDEARVLCERLRRDSERIGHKIGIAWADAGDALIDALQGDMETGPARMRAAAEALEAIPFLPDAVRIRRELSVRLVRGGRVEEGVRELRQVHDVLMRLGATQELERARETFREVGKRPPPRGPQDGEEALTEREQEIVRFVLARKSNKAIGKTLGISARTVSTHLTNIFRKLNLESRDDLIARQ